MTARHGFNENWILLYRMLGQAGCYFNSPAGERTIPFLRYSMPAISIVSIDPNDVIMPNAADIAPSQIFAMAEALAQERNEYQDLIQGYYLAFYLCGANYTRYTDALERNLFTNQDYLEALQAQDDDDAADAADEAEILELRRSQVNQPRASRTTRQRSHSVPANPPQVMTHQEFDAMIQRLRRNLADIDLTDRETCLYHYFCERPYDPETANILAEQVDDFLLSITNRLAAELEASAVIPQLDGADDSLSAHSSRSSVRSHISIRSLASQGSAQRARSTTTRSRAAAKTPVKTTKNAPKTKTPVASTSRQPDNPVVHLTPAAKKQGVSAPAKTVATKEKVADKGRKQDKGADKNVEKAKQPEASTSKDKSQSSKQPTARRLDVATTSSAAADSGNNQSKPRDKSSSRPSFPQLCSRTVKQTYVNEYDKMHDAYYKLKTAWAQTRQEQAKVKDDRAQMIQEIANLKSQVINLKANVHKDVTAAAFNVRSNQDRNPGPQLNTPPPSHDDMMRYTFITKVPPSIDRSRAKHRAYIMDAWYQTQISAWPQPRETNFILRFMNVHPTVIEPSHDIDILKALSPNEIMVLGLIVFSFIRSMTSTAFYNWNLTGLNLHMYTSGMPMSGTAVQTMLWNVLRKPANPTDVNAPIFYAVNNLIYSTTGSFLEMGSLWRADWNDRQQSDENITVWRSPYLAYGHETIQEQEVLAIDTYLALRPLEWGISTPSPETNLMVIRLNCTTVLPMVNTLVEQLTIMLNELTAICQPASLQQDRML